MVCFMAAAGAANAFGEAYNMSLSFLSTLLGGGDGVARPPMARAKQATRVKDR